MGYATAAAILALAALLFFSFGCIAQPGPQPALGGNASQQLPSDIPPPPPDEPGNSTGLPAQAPSAPPAGGGEAPPPAPV